MNRSTSLKSKRRFTGATVKRALFLELESMAKPGLSTIQSNWFNDLIEKYEKIRQKVMGATAKTEETIKKSMKDRKSIKTNYANNLQEGKIVNRSNSADKVILKKIK